MEKAAMGSYEVEKFTTSLSHYLLLTIRGKREWQLTINI